MRSEPPALLPLFRSRHQADLLTWLFLHPDSEYTTTELTRRLKVPLTTLHREAQRLVEAGLLNDRPAGRSRLRARRSSRSRACDPRLAAGTTQSSRRCEHSSRRTSGPCGTLRRRRNELEYPTAAGTETTADEADGAHATVTEIVVAARTLLPHLGLFQAANRATVTAQLGHCGAFSDLACAAADEAPGGADRTPADIAVAHLP